jgi:hypothetical protein
MKGIPQEQVKVKSHRRGDKEFIKEGGIARFAPLPSDRCSVKVKTLEWLWAGA